MSPLDMAISGAYALALLALPLRPVAASAAIVVVTLAEVMMPMDSWAVQSMWGLWYALIVLTMRGLLWPAVAAIVVLSCLSLAQGDRMLITTFHPSMMLMLPFLVVACMLGLGMRMWRLEMRRKERAEARRALLERENAQYRERLDLLHRLHGEVAGSLAYAVLLCRRMREENGRSAEADSDSAGYAARVEEAVTQALGSLRHGVIEPTRRLVEEGPPVGAADGHPSEGTAASGDAMATIRRHVERAADRLRGVGLPCETVVRGDPSGLDGERAALIVRVVDEMGNNMVKYAVPGPCAIAVVADDAGGVRVWSSNACAGANAGEAEDAGEVGDGESSLSGGTGLALLRDSLAVYGGSLTVSREDDIWTASAVLPAPIAPTV
ncbi:sensor histidine kinase [Bifidobacterium avesanii]|uniref:Histidine kinase n=1 Tax=Bifidobacterium avesanii TaxID=1798157 RepID=A0A7K3TGC5_9BIFI|nr:hypothetical protein [Bifidobacterium avesanii]NEG77724.1 hypothetical protein [Bifidobacterium avesanii]